MNSCVKNILGVNLKELEKRTHQQRKLCLGSFTLIKINWELQNIELRNCKSNGKINSKSISTYPNECPVSLLN